MQRTLPAKPHLEHLKSQAKDLLDAHRRGDPLARARIREAVPAFSRKDDAGIAAASFALHDAQSAVAREYGFASWAALRAQVSAAHGHERAPSVQILSELAPDRQDAMRRAMLQRGSGADTPTPDHIPVLPLRNAVVFPGAMAPIELARPRTLRGIEVALTRDPAFLAIFAQRQFEVEVPTTEDLHSTGCLCVIRHFERLGDSGHAWIIVEGMRWITLDSLEQSDPYYLASVANTSPVRDDESPVAGLDQQLRAKARRVAEQLPEIRDAALALIDATPDTAQLADLVMASFAPPVPVAAAYADELTLSARVERVLALLDQELASASSRAQ